MILLDVVDDDVVGRRQLVELRREFGPLRRVDRVDEGGLLAALDEVGVVARAPGQRDEGVEQTAVPVDGTDQVDVGDDLTWLHDAPHEVSREDIQGCFTVYPRRSSLYPAGASPRRVAGPPRGARSRAAAQAADGRRRKTGP